MKKAALSGKKKVIHPLFCWDVVSLQLSKIYYRWDLMIIERARQQYNWEMDFSSILAKPYHSFLVIDSSCRIRCRSKKSSEFLQELSQLSSFARLTTFQRLQHLFICSPPNMSHPFVIKGVRPDFSVKVFRIEGNENGHHHFFVLVSQA
jgi:hypothetical protein